MKRTLALLLSLTLLLLCTACSLDETGSAPESPQSAPDASGGGEAIKMTMIGGMPGGPAWGVAQEGFYEACGELGWNGQYLAPQAAANQAEIVVLAETAITNGCNVLFALMTDAELFADLLDEARSNGVVVIGAVVGVEGYCDAVIGTDQYNLGRASARALVEAAGDEPIHATCMVTTLSGAATVESLEGFTDQLLELRPDAVIYDPLECQSSTTTAYDNLAAFKLANPQLNALASFNSYAGLGGAAYVEEYGIADEFFLIGIDDAEEILSCIYNGSMDCTVAQMWYNIGYDGAYLAKAILDGDDYRYDNDSGTHVVWPDEVESYAAAKGYQLG